MKKLLTLTAIAILTQAAQLQAQTANPLRIGFGISNGIPTENQFGYSLGGDIQLQKNISTHLAATFSAGFNHYFETEKAETTTSPPYPVYAPYNAIPIKAGLKVFAGKNLYLAGEAGAGFFLEGGKPCLIWSPSVGVAFTNGLDLSLKYESFNHYKGDNQVALRIAYSVDSKKIRFKPKSTTNGGWELNASINPGVSFNNPRFVIGADLQLERDLSENLALTLSAGFTHFSDQTATYTYQSSSVTPVTYQVHTGKNLIPVKLGIKVFPVKGIYVAAAAGLGVDINGNSSFLYAVTVGTKLSNRFGLGLKYEDYTDFYHTNQLALRLTYRIF